ncbi:MAG: hypothetical protein ACT4QF_17890 [Sporichthyaceae bacterium]
MAGIESVNYSPEYVPQQVPVLEGSTRARRARRCGNCVTAPATTTRGGYPCCESCAVLADLPPRLRRACAAPVDLPSPRRPVEEETGDRLGV